MSKAEPEHALTLRFDGDFDMKGLIRHLHRLGGIGASRSVEAIDENDKPVPFGWDGDGADKIWEAELDGSDILAEPVAQDGVCGGCGGSGCDKCGGSGVSPLNNWPMKPGLGAMDADFEALLADIAVQREPLAMDASVTWFEDNGRGGAFLTLALDRDSSQGQRTDEFERLHVKRAPITKAGVNPYYGHEIPKGRELGLEPQKVYRLLRDPDEIKKGAATSHNVPLLDKHVPHSADEHDGDITVGTVGSEAKYEHPYLYNSLAVWSRDGRDHIDGGSQKELSSAYSYDADMTPGTYEGEPHDGVMRNMKWNHVCLVKKGRAGSDVALDEALKPQEENLTMATRMKSLKATVAYGAVTAYLQPKIAMDAKLPNIAGALATFEAGKFKESTGPFVKALGKSLGKLKLAQDADLAGVVDGVQKLMASIDGDKTVEDGAMPDPEDTGLDDDDGETSMDGGMDAVAAYLKSKGVPDDVIAGMPGMQKEEAMDGMTPEEMEAKKKADAMAKDKDSVATENGPDGKGDKFVSKGAMDAALRANTEATIKRMNGVTAALAKVKPIVGELDMAFDSAEGVYRHAFKMQDRDVSKIKELPALEALWDAIPVPGARKQREPIAQDSADDGFAKMFPNAAKVRAA